MSSYASRIIEQYYCNVLKRMAGANPFAETFVLAGPHFLQAKHGVKRDADREAIVDSIYEASSQRLKRLTRRLWKLPVSPHDWRDIYATDYLNKRPGDVLTLAMILNDKPETVIRAYATPDSARLSRGAARILDDEYEATAAKLRCSM